ncbi:MAG: hypothetical protein WBO10_06270 [Pyrinomonadaceae bacterium]
MTVRLFDELISVLTLWKENLATYQADVGATAADIAWAIETLANLIYIKNYCAAYDANKKASIDIKQSYFNAEKGSTVSDFPPMAAAVVPFPPLVGGVLFTFRDMAARFKLAPGYTEEIGIALGIAGGKNGHVPEAEVEPQIEVHAAQSGYIFAIVVAKREQADQWRVEILRAGETVWENAGTFTGKSADVTVSTKNPGQPEQIQVRVQLIRNNANYGNTSPARTVTVNP